ncbi:UvrD-helicase domain-containing protein [Vibrio fluvialis]|nr:UvrD-helicase domain-containing protein [Vibrio fluvialis]
MSFKFHLKKFFKSLNITRRSKRKITAFRFKKHYHNLGFRNGYKSAKDELTYVIEHAYAKEPEYDVIPSDHVVPPEPIDFREEDVELFYEKVFGSQAKSRLPNRDQHQLIFSTTRNTLAVAGAGSGKTTSLINRLLFLHKVCGVQLDQLTVFSFTRASVADFRKKLIEVFGANGITVTPEKSEQIIRTFHSKVLEMARASFLKGQFKIFEFLKDKVDGDYDSDDTEINYKAALKEANEQVVVISELNSAQNDLLYKSLDRCYQENDDFRKNMDKLFIAKLKLKMALTEPSFHINIISKTNKFESQLAPLMSDFFNLGEGACSGTLLDLGNSEFSQLKLTSDAYYPRFNLHVIFAPNSKLLKLKNLDVDLEVDGFKQRLSALTKRKAFIGAHYAKDNVFVVSDQEDVIALEMLLNNKLLEHDKRNEDVTCPRFTTKFDGDFSYKPIVDVFFEIATFTESIGIKLEHVAIHTNKASHLSETDKLLLESVGYFWGMFDKVLSEENVIRFNNLFQTFSTPGNKAFKALSHKAKRSLTNIIIDEFQDISPEVALWINATLRTLTQEGFKSSLMCVGDDFQSIYGWRGSSTEFLSEYETKFPSLNTNKVFMSQNYRSYQSIVDTAESCLMYAKDFNKTGECVNFDEQERLFFIQSGPAKNCPVNPTIKPAVRLLASIQQALESEERIDDDTDLLVMSKTNAVNDKLKRAYKNHMKYQTNSNIKVQFETFHRSKGLEARYCLLVEDCEYDTQHHAKNYLYKLAGFKKTYDEAQTEEAMRLAYVAVTRAKEKVWWVTPEDSSGSFDIAKRFAEKNRYAAESTF